jgi:hypothetical protein
MDADSYIDTLLAELERLGLDPAALNGLSFALGSAGFTDLLARLRTLQPGATWREVFPDAPAGWKPGVPETWITPYVPSGLYDYQELPTGPLIHVLREGPRSTGDWLERFVSSARKAGWPVHGAGPIPGAVSETKAHALVVVERGTADDTLDGFARWIEAQPGFTLASIPRRGNEHYGT